ncbi:MAG: hypothetical protein HY927_14785 [Elusimicrobia bacterium]|nr:hypothetical protein [Elusimicrobiota bacterium]
MRRAWPLCAAAVLLLGGCTRISQSLYLASYDREIRKGARAIEGARDDVQRATGYSLRGGAYSEKARYSRAFKLIPADEYGRLFDLSIKDHDQAVALDGGSAEAYVNRGQAYYDRAVLEHRDSQGDRLKDSRPWFDSATADFAKAAELDPRHYLAIDRLGLVHETLGEMDKAIGDYTRAMGLNPRGKVRLADAYCMRGSSYQREKKFDSAVADFERSIELGSAADGCSCDPYDPLLGLYIDASRRYDKAWDLVHQARKSGRWIAPELLDQLKKDSGRND